MSWIIGRSAGSTQPSLGRVSLSLNSYQNPQFGMTINNIPLLEITDFGPPARGGHFVLFHSFLPPQPYGTQFHSVHTSPVQLVSLALPHVGGRVYKSSLLKIKDFNPLASGGGIKEEIKNTPRVFVQGHKITGHYLKKQCPV